MRRLLLPALLVTACTLAISLDIPLSALAEKRGIRVDGKSAEAYVAEQSGKAWAVVIGIDDYQNPKIGNLRYAVADAKAVAKTLEQQGYQVTALYNEQATRRAIERELRSKLPRRAGKQDRVLVFYAGHGQDDTVEGGQTMGYLLPVDSDRDDIPATGISMGTVKELADALPAKHALFLLDVCFGGIAGTVKRGSPPAVTEAYLKQITREKGRHLITAGEANQEVIEAPKWGHSVFTYFLLKGLNEGLADQDDNGIITARELHSYLESRVFGEAQLQGHKQRPVFSELSGEQGQFVFFTSATGKAGTLSGHAALTPAAPVPVPTGPSAALTQKQQELAELEAATQKAEDEAKQAELDRRIEEKKHQLAEKKKKLEVASLPTPSLPRQTGREVTGKDGAPMLLVSAGEFLYGSNDQRLSLSAFYMDKYEVTTKLYAAFLQATSRKQPDYWNKVSVTSVGDRPVVGVDWHDADAYCRQYGKRLPTEQEWEKAARGTDGRKYPWGNDEPSSRYANYGQAYDSNFYSTRLTAIGNYEAGKSPYGIYDLAGNVWEWTSSEYGSSNKVIRGGSWLVPAFFLESSNQNWTTPTDRNTNMGFRCVQDAP